MARRLLYLAALCVVLLTTAWSDQRIAGSASRPAARTPAITPAPWPMFHHDERHTGVADGTGTINPVTAPLVRWKYQVPAPPSQDNFATYRWYSSFPLGDLDGDGTLEVVVTTADNMGQADRVIALKDMPNQTPPVQALWTYTSPLPPSQWGFDQYSAALADADGDGLLDVIFASKDGVVRALKGTNGQLIWQYDTNHFIEAGPMIADLDGDGKREVIVVTDCAPGPECVSSGGSGGALYVFATRPPTDTLPLWSLDFPYKLDSAEPAIVDLDPNDGQNRKALILGSWGGQLHVVWRKADATIVKHGLDIRTLDPHITYSATPAIRSSPLVADFGQGPTAVFGWMPDPGNGVVARISAVGLSADMPAGTLQFTPRWTLDRDDWKSSVALLPVDNGPPLVVAGYGIGLPPNSGTGGYGICAPPTGGIVAINAVGQVAWERVFENEGNVRASPAVADIDGDGQLEVLLSVGCFGKLYAYDGTTGRQEWGIQLGPRTIGTPSLCDLDGDGSLEIVVGSYDGNVWVLGGGMRLYLPLVDR